MDSYKAKLEENRSVYEGLLAHKIDQFLANPTPKNERPFLDVMAVIGSYNHSIREIEARVEEPQP